LKVSLNTIALSLSVLHKMKCCNCFITFLFILLIQT
jgi:hypothetical protein